MKIFKNIWAFFKGYLQCPRCESFNVDYIGVQQRGTRYNSRHQCRACGKKFER